MPDLSTAPVRIARPAADLAATERFWVQGVGLDVLWRSGEDVEGGHRLVMIGPAGGSWHLEFVDDPASAAQAVPTEEDLLVLYLGEPASAEWLARIERAGGERVTARNPYWETWGVTIRDPDGYSLVLSRRTWG
ncbi:glyoxalase [Brachybacterium endophyticum]|uniref:Glyoxalase n=1 Tax=Brachybacterium endophyticum TaxID=2182385 RepID=A0A2U2RK78_9MICO|nr:VOC family protein [Brachybacterium endophyticum]PWH06278.1 glyoxalase [Brachybacterium endophyticum]